MSWKPVSAKKTKNGIKTNGHGQSKRQRAGDASGNSQTVANREHLCLLLMLSDVGFLTSGRRLGGGTEMCHPMP